MVMRGSPPPCAQPQEVILMAPTSLQPTLPGICSLVSQDKRADGGTLQLVVWTRTRCTPPPDHS